MRFSTRLVASSFIIIFAFAMRAWSATIIAGPIVDPTNGHDYYLLSPDTWTNSEAEAVSLGGTLAVINDAAENAWVFSNFSDYGGTERDLWIGLQDVNHTGNFTWADGESVNYTNWAEDEPNYLGSETYVYILPSPVSSAGVWNNDYNSSSSNYQDYRGYNFGPYPNDGVVEVVSGLSSSVPLPPASLMLPLGFVCAACAKKLVRTTKE